MKFDEKDCLIMEHVGFPGSVGDSCAETARYKHLRAIAGHSVEFGSLAQFQTEAGFVRHPDSPWREDDMSSDQLLPLFLAARCFESTGGDGGMTARIRSSGYRTGNGDLVSPTFYALLTGRKWLLNITLAAQAAFFKLPWRWNDERRALERSAGSSCDYLNWIHAALYASLWVRRMIDKQTMITKVSDYYKNEPNSDWVVDSYVNVIQNFF